jgi:hypothetical protein
MSTEGSKLKKSEKGGRRGGGGGEELLLDPVIFLRKLSTDRDSTVLFARGPLPNQMGKYSVARLKGQSLWFTNQSYVQRKYA